jgi:phosphoribosylformylglycinamidine cyclo-ligase
VGIYDNLLFSSSIDRNKNRIPGEVLQALIEGTQEFFDEMSRHGVNIHFLGGETADVGDVVRTVAVNGTMTARWQRKRMVTNEGIGPGNIILGIASYGKAVYEQEYNSGIGSNGLTSARHDVLNKYYAKNFPESFDDTLEQDVVYIGLSRLTDELTVTFRQEAFTTTAGKLLLSPTRTFAPVVKTILENNFDAVAGLIHCSGGGQTKCMKYMPEGVRVVKDNLFEVPKIFRLIQESSGADEREMYQVFNMGCRLEVYTNEKSADDIICTAQGFGLDAQVIGRVEAGESQSLLVKTSSGSVEYQF